MHKKSLLEFEHYFAQQLAEIDRIPWASLQIKLIDQIVHTIRATFPERDQQSYYTELVPKALHVFQAAPEQLHWIDPDILVRTVQWIQKDRFIRNSRQKEKREELLATAHRIISRTYFRLGDFSALLQFLTSHGVFSGDLLNNLPESRTLFLEQYQTDLPSPITHALHQEMESPEIAHDSLCGLFTVSQKEVKAGILGRIALNSVQLIGERGPDQILIATHLVQEQDIIASQTQAICQFLRKNYDIADGKQIRIKFALDQPSSLLTGNSVGLLLALLSEYGLRGYLKQDPWTPLFNQGTVFTGAMDGEGNVREVNEVDIPVKIEAAFFGPTHTVIIPPKHQESAEQKYGELKKRYPNRELSILPVSHFSEIHEHPAVVKLHKRSIPERMRQFLQNYALPVSIFVILIFALSSIGMYEFVIKKEVPAVLDTRQNRIQVKNGYGVILWQSEPYGSEQIAQYYQGFAQITDLDNDQEPEILFLYDGSTIQGFRNSIACYNAEGEILWKKPIKALLSTADDELAAELQTLDINNDGNKEVQVSIASENETEDQVVVFSHTGERLQLNNAELPNTLK